MAVDDLVPSIPPAIAKVRQKGLDDMSLTKRQDEVLLRCAELGYYEIPRRATLRALAKGMDLSAASLSLILRRAEAKLVQRFVRLREADARERLAAP